MARCATDRLVSFHGPATEPAPAERGNRTGQRLAPTVLRGEVPILQPRLGEPLAGLTPEQHARFLAGKAAFRRMLTPEEGLGPVHNLSACAVCHSNPVGGSGTITITMFGRMIDGRFDPLHELGGPRLHAEAVGEQCRETLPRQANVVASRITTSLLGVGLIEAIPDEAILSKLQRPPNAFPGRNHQTADGPRPTDEQPPEALHDRADEVVGGGRPTAEPLPAARPAGAHLVRAVEDRPGAPERVGRFGWKAQHATVLSFSALAARNELGLTNRLVSEEDAPNGDDALTLLCDEVPDPEDRPDADGYDFIDRVTDFARFLAAPPQTPRGGMTGEIIFRRIGCADCHAPVWRTADDPALEPALRDRVIRPYSDFLLHDMGGRGDGIVQGEAGPNEMRTPPLWGFRIRFPVMHDGRVSGATLEERATRAILAHGGDAATSSAAFQSLSSEDKSRLIAFLDCLGRVEFDDDGDNDVDLADLPLFARCLRGTPARGFAPDDRCSLCDLDQNGDVNLLDFAGLQRAITGPLPPSAMAVP